MASDPMTRDGNVSAGDEEQIVADLTCVLCQHEWTAPPGRTCPECDEIFQQETVKPGAPGLNRELSEPTDVYWLPLAVVEDRQTAFEIWHQYRLRHDLEEYQSEIRQREIDLSRDAGHPFQVRA